MPLTLTVTHGANVGREYVVVREKSPRTFGQGLTADERVEDVYLSEAHFALYWDGERAFLRDLDSHYGTQVNGQGVREAALGDGYQVVVGQTAFQVKLVPDAGVVEAGGNGDALQELVSAFQDSPRDRARWALRAEGKPLYALVDLAAVPELVELLNESGEEFCALDETVEPDALGESAPCVVGFREGSLFLGQFIEEVWGRECAVFFTSEAGFGEVYAHWVRRTEWDEDGNVVSPWYWVPEVLKREVEGMDEGERREFFGGVVGVLVEGKETLSRYTINEGEPYTQELQR